MKKILLLLTISLLLTSCEDELVEAPKSIVVETFFNTAGDVETAVNAIFSPLRNSNYAVYEATLECHGRLRERPGKLGPASRISGFGRCQYYAGVPVYGTLFTSASAMPIW
jgi:hypothetical protein